MALLGFLEYEESFQNDKLNMPCNTQNRHFVLIVL
jgi:hypothetical protein